MFVRMYMYKKVNRCISYTNICMYSVYFIQHMLFKKYLKVLLLFSDVYEITNTFNSIFVIKYTIYGTYNIIM